MKLKHETYDIYQWRPKPNHRNAQAPKPINVVVLHIYTHLQPQDITVSYRGISVGVIPVPVEVFPSISWPDTPRVPGSSFPWANRSWPTGRSGHDQRPFGPLTLCSSFGLFLLASSYTHASYIRYYAPTTYGYSSSTASDSFTRQPHVYMCTRRQKNVQTAVYAPARVKWGSPSDAGRGMASASRRPLERRWKTGFPSPSCSASLSRHRSYSRTPSTSAVFFYNIVWACQHGVISVLRSVYDIIFIYI